MGQDSTGNEGAGFQWKQEKWGALLMKRGASTGNGGASSGKERNGGPK